LNTVQIRWLKLAWTIAAFLPLAAIMTPLLAPRIGVIFVVCAMYLWPASWLSRQVGVEALDGFIDTSYVAAFRIDGTALRTIVSTNSMTAVDPQQVPDSMWRQPPMWWRPNRSPTTQVYATPSFKFGARSGDGDHYLLIDDRAAGKVYVYLESNF
jgi:hypothetical protein